MDEPILTSEQKQEWIDALNLVKSDCNNVSYFDARKTFRRNGDCDITCKIRFRLCDVLINQQSLPDYDCSLCWIHWFLYDHSGYDAVTIPEIISLFGKINYNEYEKIGLYKCYSLSFDALDQGDINVIINMANSMITYLET